MKILINGNLGYIGPVLVHHLRITYPDAILIGYDTAYFAACLPNPCEFPERYLDQQYFGDIRKLSNDVLDGVDVVIQLAGISNDPMGLVFEEATAEINSSAAIQVAKLAKEAGVKHFVFASSCSVYGTDGDAAKTEDDQLNPLTAYAKSKIDAERGLQPLASSDFTITCLRFATACGFSPRLRVDLVLNDFVASAISTGVIVILSDGSPFRPLIHVKDMSRAMEWACTRSQESGGPMLVVNVGADDWNYQIKDLALGVKDVLDNVQVVINENASPDKRSYQVDFSKFAKLAPNHKPIQTLKETVKGLYDGLNELKFKDPNFRDSNMMRLKVLTTLKDTGKLDSMLYWKL